LWSRETRQPVEWPGLRFRGVPFEPEMPERELSESDVIAWLGHAREAASLREMAAGLTLRNRGRHALKKIIAKLRRRGEIEEVRSGRYRLAGRSKPIPAAAATPPRGRAPARAIAAPRDAGVITGRLVAHHDGYGFVVPDRPVPGMDGDLFVGRDAIGDAMHGDRVVARIARRRPDGRAEGRIVEVERRAHATVVGRFQLGPRASTVLPFDTRIQQEIHLAPGEELSPELRAKLGIAPGKIPRSRLAELDGMVVNVELVRFPRGGAAPTGKITEILGRQGEFGVDVEIIIRKHHLPHVFAEEVQAAARGTPQQVREADFQGRSDFRNLPIVTIDGETARDFDDAVYVERHGNGFELQVHIADVAHYVERNSALDREARVRGTSVYFPDRAVPMLPEELSNGICSLNPQVDRLVMSARMQLEADGRVSGAEFASGVIRSAERMTYTNVSKVLDGDAEQSGRYAALAERFRLMRELALLMNARRRERGSIDFDLPEPLIEFDDEGRMTGIVRSERNMAHRIIEEFMLAANEAVARYLMNRGIIFLHRVHEIPDPKKVLEFEELAHAFGYSLGIAKTVERQLPVRHSRPRPGGDRSRGRQKPMTVVLPELVEIRPQHYQRLTEKIAGKPEERILSYLMLRSLKQARYSAEPLGHFALATNTYAHFTSPIRRYPDLIVHRALKWALEHPDARPDSAPRRGKEPEEASLGPYHRVEAEEIADESSEAERRSVSAERELRDWKTVQFMEERLGDEYGALIISVQKFGFFVELMEVFVEGLVPVPALEEALGERCRYREGDHSIVAERSKRTFRLGDRLRVRAERVDPFRMRVEFAPLLPRR